jgi:hypothetical protein
MRASSAWLGAALVAGLVAAYYAPSLGNDFVWDDRLTAAAPPGLETILTERTGAYYRPVVMLSFVGDRQLWGLSPAGFRLTNLVCHLLVACLLLNLSRALGLTAGTALAAALVFAAHPVQTEAVTYISGRTDPLSALFILLALLAWRRARYVVDLAALGSGIAIAMALLCKEAAFLVPFVFLVKGLHPADRPPRPIVPMAVALVWLVVWAGSGEGVRFGGFLERLPAVGIAALTYLRLLVWPSDLHLERFVAVPGWPTALTVSVWAALGLIGGALLWASRRVPGGAVWLALAVATYLPVSGLVPIHPAIADRALFAPEHFLYLPLLGLTPLVTATAAAMWPLTLRPAAPFVLGLTLAAWGAVVVDRNRDWRNEETLFRQTLRYDPPAARVWFNLANLRLADGDLREAEQLYRAALARQEDDPAAHLNLGITLQRTGRLADAERHYRHAMSLDPTNAQAYRGLATVLAQRGEPAAARAVLQDAARRRLEASQ